MTKTVEVGDAMDEVTREAAKESRAAVIALIAALAAVTGFVVTMPPLDIEGNWRFHELRLIVYFWCTVSAAGIFAGEVIRVKVRDSQGLLTGSGFAVCAVWLNALMFFSCLVALALGDENPRIP